MWAAVSSICRAGVRSTDLFFTSRMDGTGKGKQKRGNRVNKNLVFIAVGYIKH